MRFSSTRLPRQVVDTINYNLRVIEEWLAQPRGATAKVKVYEPESFREMQRDKRKPRRPEVISTRRKVGVDSHASSHGTIGVLIW